MPAIVLPAKTSNLRTVPRGLGFQNEFGGISKNNQRNGEYFSRNSSFWSYDISEINFQTIQMNPFASQCLTPAHFAMCIILTCLRPYCPYQNPTFCHEDQTFVKHLHWACGSPCWTKECIQLTGIISSLDFENLLLHLLQMMFGMFSHVDSFCLLSLSSFLAFQMVLVLDTTLFAEVVSNKTRFCSYKRFFCSWLRQMCITSSTFVYERLYSKFVLMPDDESPPFQEPKVSSWRYVWRGSSYVSLYWYWY